MIGRHSYRPMRRRSLPFLLLAAALIAGPALAEVLAEGKPKASRRAATTGRR
jgi:hypothetical protein